MISNVGGAHSHTWHLRTCVRHCDAAVGWPTPMYQLYQRQCINKNTLPMPMYQLYQCQCINKNTLPTPMYQLYQRQCISFTNANVLTRILYQRQYISFTNANVLTRILYQRQQISSKNTLPNSVHHPFWESQFNLLRIHCKWSRRDNVLLFTTCNVSSPPLGISI